MAKQVGKQITTNMNNVRLEIDMLPVFEKAYAAEYMNISIGKFCRLNVELANITLALPEDLRLISGK